MAGAIEKGQPGMKAVRRDDSGMVVEYEARLPYVHAIDDVIVKVVPMGSGQSEVVIRSRSRIGPSDFGSNARRVRELASLINTNAAAAVPPIPPGSPQ